MIVLQYIRYDEYVVIRIKNNGNMAAAHMEEEK